MINMIATTAPTMPHSATIQNAQRSVEKIALDIDLGKIDVREGLAQIKALNTIINGLKGRH